ncbi:MAG: hypothetical protein MZV63_17700 [Marinilabiliales bacterium]|nr:hypothetical protein [Marinilabiliales bacterium]
MKDLRKIWGKAGLWLTELKYRGSDIILFFDADVSNIRKEHFDDLLKPIIDNTADMRSGSALQRQ